MSNEKKPDDNLAQAARLVEMASGLGILSKRETLQFQRQFVNNTQIPTEQEKITKKE